MFVLIISYISANSYVTEPPTTSKPTIIWSTAPSAVSLTESTGASVVSNGERRLLFSEPYCSKAAGHILS